MADRSKFEAEILTPEGRVYQGEVVQLSARTALGEVGILARHEPIVALLVPGELRLHLSDQETVRFVQGEGWLEVFANRARALIAEAIPPDQLDVAAERAKIDDAERRIAESEEGSAARARAEREKLRAEAFIKIAEKR